MLCWSTSARGKNLSKKLFTGMFVQTSPQFFKLLTSLSFIVYLNYKVQFSIILMFSYFNY